MIRVAGFLSGKEKVGVEEFKVILENRPAIREKWEKYLSLTTTTVTEEYLEEKYPMVELEQNVLINASFCPTKSLVEKVKNLSKN